MYLKKLALTGFKSFADPVELEFSKGVSAIVGPNGSGKSNITDGIRWVLGEQSTKSLRGKKMEDVIFSGTEKRKPLNYAEVTLTLDNASGYIKEQLSEIVITRRLFRSGDSEYRMNQKNCKLRDIQELFMDTGLGKNGYSLISQGGIENIINATPQELRGIVEEAVGIVNYKSRKQDAEKKLEHTRQNLDRLKDILEEIEHQLGPLKKQADKAQVYLTVREELKKVDLVLFYDNMAKAQKQLEDFEGQLSTLKFDIFAAEKKAEEKDEAFRRAKESIRGITKKSEDYARELEGLKEQVAEFKREALVQTGKIENENTNIQRLTREKASYHEEWERHQLEIEALTETEVSLREKHSQLTEVNHQKETDRQELLEEFSDEKAKQQKVGERLAAIDRQKEKLHTDLLDLRTQYAAWEAQNKVKQGEIQKLVQSKVARTEQIEALAETVKERQEAVAKTKSETVSMGETVEKTEEKAQKIRETFHVAENNKRVAISKRDYLKSIQKNYTDYFPGIRMIMTSREHLGKTLDQVYGPVGELLAVDKKYMTAIDIALGGKSQNIVVESVNTANACINLLKQKKAGRATFLPLDNLRYSTVDNRDKKTLEAHKGFEGIASALVSCEPRFRKAIDSLLGRILVVTDFEAGRQIQRAVFGKYTVVTLEGEIFYPGGAIVGGSTKSGKQSPLSKKVEIEILDAEIANFEKEMENLKKDYREAMQHYQTLKKAWEKLTEELSAEEQEVWKQENHLENLRSQIKAGADAVEAYEAGEDASAQIGEDLKEAIREKELQLTELAGEVEKESGGSEEYLEVLRGAIESLNKKIGDERIELARFLESIHGTETQKKLVQTQLDRCTEREETLEKGIASSREAIAAARSFCGNLEEKILKTQAEIETKRQKLEAFSTESKGQSSISDALDREIREINHTLILQNDGKNNLEMAKNKLEMQMSHWEETIFDTYEMNFLMVEDQMPGLREATPDLSPDRQRHLKGQLSAMGNVNVNAIEEYAELNARYQFMKGQCDDVIAAKEELERIIDGLYHSMEHKFAEQFAILQKKFTRIFGILFEGGIAHVDYTDPENVLESGIELTAQPPGKNLRHISLLSGGEKSMIAIALLFSFLELNPSPFCVIDEIDAALDDSNIYRFTGYLNHIARDNQFIIITHRKTTLEVCDAIYGVSMAKNGISKMVSVRLSDYSEE